MPSITTCCLCRVVVDEELSEELSVLSSVPQGLVLGPLLFLVYINEVTSQVSVGSNVVLFADDIALYRVIMSSDDYVQLQTDINSRADWIEEYHLSLHSGWEMLCYAVDQEKYYLLAYSPVSNNIVVHSPVDSSSKQIDVGESPVG